MNGGISPHQLGVSGPGLPAGGMLWDVSFPGETSAAKTVTLRAGKYHFFCNIHPTLMHVDVVVHGTGDSVAPRLTLTRPRCPKGVTGRLCTAFRHSPRAWRTLRGTVADPGGAKASGVRSVLVTVVRKRRTDCLVFVRGAFRARTCAAAAAVRVRARLRSGGRYALGLRGIAAGRYAITIRAVDRAGNVATLRRAVVVRAARRPERRQSPSRGAGRVARSRPTRAGAAPRRRRRGRPRRKPCPSGQFMAARAAAPVVRLMPSRPSRSGRGCERGR